MTDDSPGRLARPHREPATALRNVFVTGVSIRRDPAVPEALREALALFDLPLPTKVALARVLLCAADSYARRRKGRASGGYPKVSDVRSRLSQISRDAAKLRRDISGAAGPKADEVGHATAVRLGAAGADLDELDEHLLWVQRAAEHQLEQLPNNPARHDYPNAALLRDLHRGFEDIVGRKPTTVGWDEIAGENRGELFQLLCAAQTMAGEQLRPYAAAKVIWRLQGQF